MTHYQVAPDLNPSGAGHSFPRDTQLPVETP